MKYENVPYIHEFLLFAAVSMLAGITTLTINQFKKAEIEIMRLREEVAHLKRIAELAQ